MKNQLPRRQFLQAASGLGLGAGLGPWAAVRAITPASADEAKVGPEMVRFRPEIEPVVRWIEDTPREQVFEKAVAELKGGLSYRALLAGLFLAGIRNIKPRPVGFKFHAVMVINSAHLLGQTRPSPNACSPSSGHSTTSRTRRRRRQGGRLDARQGRRVARARAPSSQGRVPPGHGGLGRRGGRRGRGRPLPGLRRGRDAWSRSGGWPSATSATSATSRSSRPRAGAPCRRSAGSTPSPCSARSPYGLLDLQGDRPKPLGPLRGQPGKRSKRSATDWQWARPTRPRRGRCSRRSARRAPKRPRPRRPGCSIRALAPAALWDAVVLSASELMMQNPGIVASTPPPRPTRCTTSSTPAATTSRASSPSCRRSAGSRSIAIGPSRLLLWKSTRLPARRRSLARGRGRRRDLRHDQRRPQSRRGQDRGLPGAAADRRADLRCRPADDLPQGDRQPRLQVRRGHLGGMPCGVRAAVARPAGRRGDVQSPRRQDGRQPPHDPRSRGRGKVMS